MKTVEEPLQPLLNVNLNNKAMRNNVELSNGELKVMSQVPVSETVYTNAFAQSNEEQRQDVHEEAASKPLLSLLFSAASSIASTLLGTEGMDQQNLTSPTNTRLTLQPKLSVSPNDGSKTLDDQDASSSHTKDAVQRASSSSSFGAVAEHDTFSSFLWDMIGLAPETNIKPEFSSPTDNVIFDAPQTQDQEAGESHATRSLSQQVDDVFKKQPEVAFKTNSKLQDENSLLQFDVIQQIHPHLPPILREATLLNLLYSIEKHGISISTLYSKCQDAGPCLIVIQNEKRNLFGAFSSDNLGIRAGFFGNGSW